MQVGLVSGRSGFIADHSYFIRFGILGLLWCVVAWDFKLFNNLSWIGLALVGLFFLSNILVFIGYKTRIAMAVLAATMAAHGLLEREMSTLAAAAIAFGSLILPIGRYYSLDRYLELGARPITPYQPSTEELNRPLHGGWKVLFGIITIYLIGGPALSQILHIDHRLLFKWHMFNSRGKELVNIQFFEAASDERLFVDYLLALGNEINRPEVRLNGKVEDMVIMGVPELDELIGRMCNTVAESQNLRLEARIATLQQGWQTLYDGEELVCTANGNAILKSFPSLETGQREQIDFWDDF